MKYLPHCTVTQIVRRNCILRFGDLLRSSPTDYPHLSLGCSYIVGRALGESCARLSDLIGDRVGEGLEDRDRLCATERSRAAAPAGPPQPEPKPGIA
jgi:hypothetical protein